MKRIKDRKLNTYFKDLIATQEIRINECGSEAYKSYNEPSVVGTILSNRFITTHRMKKFFDYWMMFGYFPIQETQFNSIKPQQRI